MPNEAKISGTKALEHQIDVLVYHLYKLSYKEALVIDAGLSLDDF